VLDVYSFLDKQSAITLHNQYNQSISKNYTFYNSQLLNDSAVTINETVISLNPEKPGFMYAVLTAFNATGTSPSGGGDPDPSASGESGSAGKKDTSTSTSVFTLLLACFIGLQLPCLTTCFSIVLYAITGCVSILFCIVITSGASIHLLHYESKFKIRNFV
jgi:hypothetical protein